MIKKYLLVIFFSFLFLLNAPGIGLSSIAHAQTTTVNVGTATPPDGSWLSDNDVTFTGKNAARAKDLFNWVLVNYQWSTDDNTLVAFWAKIRNVVFVFLIILVMISAFLMIITGGQSLTAIQFIRKFLVVIILISFSFAIIRIFYQIVDIIQSFFIKNPDGNIISSKDLLNISFNYQDFTGYRRYGPEYNESAFISLLLTKLTAATYFVMAGVLIVRKVILWFFITVSPIFPVLLLYFPVRNTAKIWIGEFFRWLLYAPLFAIFLSGLVVLWRSNINVLPFNFCNGQVQQTAQQSSTQTQSLITNPCSTDGQKPIVFPTAINILLGGPGQKLAIDNNINYTDTFAQYIVALIMLWVVIFLPFLLLRIFLDYLSTISVNNNPAWQYIRNNANKILPSNDFFVNTKQPTPPPPPAPPSYPTGIARQLPFSPGVAKTVPQSRPQPLGTAGQAATISRPAYQPVQQTVQRPAQQGVQTINTQNVSSRQTTATPVYKSTQSSVATSQLVNFPIPRMRDVAKFETSRLSNKISSHQDITRVNETLQKIANPQSITNPVERKQFSTIREKLIQAQKQGEPLATSILNAANRVTNKTILSNVTTVTNQATTNVQQTLQKMSSPQTITNVTEREQFTNLREKLSTQGRQNNVYASTVMKTIENMSHQTTQQSSLQVQQMLEKLAHPAVIKDEKEKEQMQQMKESMTQASKAGDPVATSILSETTKLAEAQAALPQINQVQTVNLEDYEEVKKTWAENYRNLEVPKTFDKPDRSREDWIKDDITNTAHAIDLLSSKDPKEMEEGMNEVSALLPFLLVGGFSQTEIVAYLQAKKHAAEEVLAETKQKTQEDETLVERKMTKHAHATMHMEQSVEQPISSGSSSEETDQDMNNPLYQVTHTVLSQQQQARNTSQHGSLTESSFTSVTVPTIKDFAKYDASLLNVQSPLHTQTQQLQDMLQKLSNPEAISDEQEKSKIIALKQQLEQSKSQGDKQAGSLLTVAEKLAQSSSTSEVMPAILPKADQAQKLNVEDYEEVRNMWVDSYKKLELPVVQEDIAKATKTVSLLTSEDTEKKKEGMKTVSELLPFLLLGGFSEAEVIAYLQAKIHAGEDVLKEKQENNEAEESVLVDKPEKDDTGRLQEMVKEPEANQEELKTETSA